MEWGPLWLSLRVASIATVLALCIGVGLATLLSYGRFRGRELLDAVVTAPLVLPPTVLGYYLLTVIGKHSFIGEAWETLTGARLVFTVPAAILAATVGAIPFVVKSARAALQALDPTLVQAARTLGAGPSRAFFTISLPLARGGILSGAMLAFAKSLGDFGVTLMIAGDIPGETQTASLYIYDAILAGNDRAAYGMIAVLSTVALAVLFTVNVIARRRW